MINLLRNINVLGIAEFDKFRSFYWNEMKNFKKFKLSEPIIDLLRKYILTKKC